MPAFLYLFGTHVHVLAHAVLLAPEAAALLVPRHSHAPCLAMPRLCWTLASKNNVRNLRCGLILKKISLQLLRKLDGWLTAAKALFCDTIVLASHEMMAEGVKH